MTDEEQVAGGHLDRARFPRLSELSSTVCCSKHPPPGQPTAEPPQPHPEAVEEILSFLAERHLALSTQLEAGADSERLVWARAMTEDLIDLVLCRLYRLRPGEREQVDMLG